MVLLWSTNSLSQTPQSKLLITVDKQADIFLDGESKAIGRVDVGDVKKFTVDPGDHYVEAKSVDGAWSVKQRIAVNPHEGKIVELKLSVPTEPQIGVVGSFVDPRDNTTYKIVTINGKTWMGENLRYRTQESDCYKNQTDNCSKYGRHYTLNEARLNACPKG